MNRVQFFGKLYLLQYFMNFFKKLLKTKSTITSTLSITSSNGFHLRPIAQFVNEAKKYDATITLIAKDKEVSALQMPKILALSLEKGESFTLKCKGDEAKEANEALGKLFHRLMNNDKEIDAFEQVSEIYEAPTLKGQTIAKGVAIAPLFQYKLVETTENIEGNATTLRNAIEATKDELQHLYEKESNQEEAHIFLAQKELLSSSLFEQNFSSIRKFKKSIKIQTEALKETKFASRIADYQDLEQKVLSHLGIKHELKSPVFPYILVANELLPSEIAQLNKTPIKGVVLQSGTTTSHAAILLRSSGIPSLIVPANIASSRNAILDANSGDLIVQPTKSDLTKAQEKQQLFIEELDKNFEKRFEKTTTDNGESVSIMANITDITSAKEAKGLGADGVGLFRSEFLFTHHKPTVEEQTEAYLKVFKLFNSVTIRTLDIGGDKSLPYITIEREENPFLGIRGIRFSLQEQTLLKEQLLAIFKAHQAVQEESKEVKIMFPMISTLLEFKEAKKIALEVAQENSLDISNIQLGMMIEVPSVIFALKDFDSIVDFYSIGTNDLTQYLFAIERTHPTLSVDIASPVILNTLKHIIETSSKPISICGELAGEERATKRLIEMGYTTLSVSAKLIPSIKEKIRHV